MHQPPPPPHLLLVDDDARLRELLVRYLETHGFRVKGVGDGAQMRQALDRGHYDLIVLDLMLPGEDGLEICRRLRGQDDATPIVMLTAKGDEIDRIVGLEIGATTTCPSRSIRASCWRASDRCCAVHARCPARRRPTAAKSASGTSVSTWAGAS